MPELENHQMKRYNIISLPASARSLNWQFSVYRRKWNYLCMTSKPMRPISFRRIYKVSQELDREDAYTRSARIFILMIICPTWHSIEFPIISKIMSPRTSIRSLDYFFLEDYVRGFLERENTEPISGGLINEVFHGIAGRWDRELFNLGLKPL